MRSHLKLLCSVCCLIIRRLFLGQVAFHLLPILPQTLDAIDSESCQTSFPSFCAPQSEVAVLFYLNLSRLPFLGQVVNLHLLLCTGFDSEQLFCSYVIFLLSDECMIARSSKAMGAALICKNFSSIPSKISFHIKKKSVVTAQYLQSIKTFLILEVSQYRKSGSTLSSNEPDSARSYCRQL